MWLGSEALESVTVVSAGLRSEVCAVEAERSPRDHSGGTSLGKTSLLLAVAAAGGYVLSLLLIVFVILFPQHVPDDAPLLAVLAIGGPFLSFALGVLASLLGLGCVLLQQGGRSYALITLLIGASLVSLTAVLTLQPWEVLRPILQS